MVKRKSHQFELFYWTIFETFHASKLACHVSLCASSMQCYVIDGLLEEYI